MTHKRHQYLFGPVPSRRLGRSLGVDIIPMKTCTQNCIYCQLGKDATQTLERKKYADIHDVLSEIGEKIEDGLEADTITISGSGEPTLHSDLGELIDGIRKITDIPVAVITNGTLLSLPDVRRDCCKADIVLPSLDAGDAETFEKMNRPHPDLDFETFVGGIVEFSKEYTGKLWLEVFLCEGVNADESALDNLKKQIERIAPAKIQLNTAVRPVAHLQAVRVEPERMEVIARQFGPTAEVIADFSKHTSSAKPTATEIQILDMLRRRPCRLVDICDGLGISDLIAGKLIDKLIAESKIQAETIDRTAFFRLP